MSRESTDHDHVPADWPTVARLCAGEAYRLRGDCPRGLFALRHECVLAFFDSDLSRDSMRTREQRAASFARFLDEIGVATLAESTYPLGGPDDGLTLAMVLDAEPDRADDVAAAWCRAFGN